MKEVVGVSEAVDEAPWGLMVALSSRGSLDCNAISRSHIQTPESRPQVFMSVRGELAIHDDVVFEANAAASDGGAVSLPFHVGLA